MNILLVDDEAPAREELAWLIAQCGDDLQVVAHAASAQDALRKLDDEALEIDLAILDINMAGIDGVRLAELWQERDERPLVIFVTAYQDRAVDAFAVDAVDYLLRTFRYRVPRELAHPSGGFGGGRGAAMAVLGHPFVRTGGGAVGDAAHHLGGKNA